jgi:hypothetical protein
MQAAQAIHFPMEDMLPVAAVLADFKRLSGES